MTIKWDTKKIRERTSLNETGYVTVYFGNQNNRE